MRTATDKTCLSYWFPMLVEADIAVPKTMILHTSIDLWELMDGKHPDGYGDFIHHLGAIVSEMGTPCFLRTGQTSGKHDWISTCYLRSAGQLNLHVYKLVEYSALVSLVGLPTDVWVVRELLNTKAAFHAFNGMPITKERRYFVRDGVCEFYQPYWPPDSIEDADDIDWGRKLAKLNLVTSDEVAELGTLTEQIGRAIPGYWSVDWLWTTDRGWVCTDMAEGDKSFKWEDYKPLFI